MQISSSCSWPWKTFGENGVKKVYYSAFHYYSKVPEAINLQREKVYFG
jgi:hypothetical protein